MLTPIYTSHVTLGRLHTTSVPQFPQLQSESLNRTYQERFGGRGKNLLGLCYNINDIDKNNITPYSVLYESLLRLLLL